METMKRIPNIAERAAESRFARFLLQQENTAECGPTITGKKDPVCFRNGEVDFFRNFVGSVLRQVAQLRVEFDAQSLRLENLETRCGQEIAHPLGQRVWIG